MSDSGKRGLLKKQGLFGFEADVKFSDPAVKRVADLLTFGCHFMLKSMGRKSSPIYWRKFDNQISQDINNYLVTLSTSLIEQASCSANNIEPGEDKIKEQLTTFLYR